MSKKTSEFSKPLFSKNWESDIQNVLVESCPLTEDPLGYKAVFYLAKESERAAKNKSFIIGASFLAQRAHNLVKAGYQAPMTEKAITLVEGQIGDTLSLLDEEYLARVA